eukprot:CAMPEP_0168329944 /NCGR_PEP_ID=MMETSP0213-20121227/7415_1 /TAXON_ID=151035 /ORGANISM="Euplotes harpa, Strain FSP1.4" /LENGTH=37 /DNA_ID= /DNA_START= /DNA_END= /DNA_ORIENTATION=
MKFEGFKIFRRKFKISKFSPFAEYEIKDIQEPKHAQA